MKRTLIACAALLLVIACSHDSSPTAPMSGMTGRLIVTVVDANTRTGVANVTIQLIRTDSSAMTMTETTNAKGVAEFVTAGGRYRIHLAPPESFGPVRSTTDSEVLVGSGITTMTIDLIR